MQAHQKVAFAVKIYAMLMLLTRRKDGQWVKPKTIRRQTECRYKSLVTHATDTFGEEYIKKITSNDID